MATATNLSIDVRVNVAFTCAILRCAAEIIAPKDELERVIASAALAALCDLQEQAQAARRILGLGSAELIELALTVEDSAHG